MRRLRNAAERVVAGINPTPSAPRQSGNPFSIDEDGAQDPLIAAGIITDPARVRYNRLLNAISIAAPATGAIAAFVLLPATAPSLATLAVFVLFFFIQAFGISIGLHRYFTHRAFRPKRWLALCLAIAGSWSFQGPIARWVADHRRHHRFSDSRFDPHSPYWTDKAPISGRLAGWSNAHLLWMLTGRPSCERRYASDVLADPIESWATLNYWLLAASGLAAPAAAGLLLGGEKEALACFLWAGCFRVSVLHQITWSVNSFGHMIGSKVAGSRDEARDNSLLAILLIGEGLHSFHHRFPLSAVNEPAKFDLSGAVLKLLERFGAVDLGGAARS